MNEINLYVLCNDEGLQNNLSLIFDNLIKKENLKLNIVYSKEIKDSKKEIRYKLIDFIIVNYSMSDDKLIKIVNNIKQDKYISNTPIVITSNELKDDDFRNKILNKGLTLYTKNDIDISTNCLCNLFSLHKVNSKSLKETFHIRRIWNTSKNINIITDEKLNIIDFNKTAIKKFDFIDIDMRIEKFVSLMDVEDNQELLENLNYSLEIFGNMSKIYTFKYQNQYYKLNVRFLNQINNYLIIFEDITSLYKQKQDNERLHQKHIEDLEKSKDKMITIFTHELKTPLNGILGYASYISRALAKKALNEKKIDKLSTLSNEITALGHVLLSTINSLVDMSVLKDNKLEVKK